MGNISIGKDKIIGFSNPEKAVKILKEQYNYVELVDTCANCIWFKDGMCTVNSRYTWPTTVGSKCNRHE